MSILEIPTARAFTPLLKQSRYKGAWGGRGSGKSHFFAGLALEHAIAIQGLRMVCIREVQKTLDQSVKRLLEDKLEQFGPPGFEVMRSEIKTPGNGIVIFQGMQDHTAASIKSLEGFDIAWVEEAQTLSQRSLDLLRPTIRKPGSELWFSWNPENETDPVDKFLRGPNAPPNAIVVRANWSDNPWLPAELRAEMELDRADFDKFGHVWEGGYRKAVEGAYYAEGLALAEKEGRITRLTPDPLVPVRAVWDLGMADSTAIWVVQWVGHEIRWLDYLEGQGQPLSYYVNELRARGWGSAKCILPHDGAKRDLIQGHRYSDHLRAAEFDVDVIENQGRGAAMLRIEAGRRLFPRMWFDLDKTRAGRSTLAQYHERRDEVRNIGLGPEHDWASHGCLVAGSLVETARGAVPVELVVPGDKVATPVGEAIVLWAGKVKEAAELIEITLTDGRVLVSTPEHKFFTTDGLLRADALGYNVSIVTMEHSSSWKLANANSMGYRAAFTESFGAKSIGSGKSGACTSAKKVGNSVFSTAKRSGLRGHKLSRSMEIGTISAKAIGSFARDITGRAIRPFTIARSSMAFATIGSHGDIILGKWGVRLFTCIGQFGSGTTGRSLTVSTSTTSTRTSQTTVSKIWRSFLRLSTFPTMQLRVNGWGANRTNLSSENRLNLPSNGIGATRGANGILKTERIVGLFGSLSRKIAAIAARFIRPITRTNQNSAVAIAKLRRIESVSVPVFDLTVEHDHCYFANGFLVSNSDAFGLGCIAYEEPRSPAKRPRGNTAAAGAWMG